MFTSPKEIDPFQSALATSAALQLAFGFEPVVEVLAVAAAAFEVAVVRPLADLLFARPHVRRQHVFARLRRRCDRRIGGLRRDAVDRDACAPITGLRCRWSFRHTCRSVANSFARSLKIVETPTRLQSASQYRAGR